jgi:hypothetical protein
VRPYSHFVLVTVFTDDDESTSVAALVGFTSQAQRDEFLVRCMDTEVDSNYAVIGESVNTMDVTVSEDVTNITPNEPLAPVDPHTLFGHLVSLADLEAHKKGCHTTTPATSRH